MLVRSSLFTRLPPLLFFAFISLTLARFAQAEPLNGRRQSLNRHREDGSRSWPESDGQKSEAAQEVIAVRKMKDSEGEMFFQEYWRFDGEADDWDDEAPYNPKDSKLPNDRAHYGSNAADYDLWRNASMFPPYEAPFALHRNTETSPSYAHWVRSLLSKRDFQCPDGTGACVGINRPNSCCPSGSSCQVVANTGHGDVACCGRGQTCAGEVQHCAEGYQTCPGAAGGGCCVPGYACIGTVGCAQVSTTTVLVNPSVTASPPASNSSSASETASTTTALAPLPLPPPSTTTSSATTTTTTSSLLTPTTTITPSPSSSTSTSSTSNAFVAPARPTSSAATTTTRFLSASPPDCPTGFYQCSAYYHGGCCRVGRDCALTDCPPAINTGTVAQGNGVTVLAPTTSAAGGEEGRGCASGWRGCGADVGGGCCPADFDCGRESCVKGSSSSGAKVTGAGENATAGGGVSVAKVGEGGAGSGGNGRGRGCATSWIILGAIVLGGGWLLL